VVQALSAQRATNRLWARGVRALEAACVAMSTGMASMALLVTC
jgi:hypothetical protein